MSETKLKENYVRKNKVGVLREIEEEYYAKIFKLISSTVVLGNNKKYNTLVYLENKVMTADKKALKEMGFPVDDALKTEYIKTVLVRFIEISKEIRKDQWKTAKDETKEGSFEARKHLTEDAVIDRNVRLMKKFHIGRETAKRFGVALSVDELKESYKVDDEKREKMLKEALKDPAFVTFNENFKTVYKLGEPTKENTQFLYTIYEDLKKGEENSFGLKGKSLKTAINLVEKAIRVRRNTFDFNKERKNSKVTKEDAIEEKTEPSELQ